MSLKFATMPQLRRRMRDKFRSSEDPVRVCRAAKWLLNNCTDAQLGNVFEKTGQDLIDLKARLVRKRNRLDDLLSERGE